MNKKVIVAVLVIILLLSLSGISYYFYKQVVDKTSSDILQIDNSPEEVQEIKGKDLNQEKLLLSRFDSTTYKNSLFVADLKNKTVVDLSDKIELYEHFGLNYSPTGEILITTSYDGGEGGALPYNKSLLFKANAWWPNGLKIYSYDSLSKIVDSGNDVNLFWLDGNKFILVSVWSTGPFEGSGSTGYDIYGSTFKPTNDDLFKILTQYFLKGSDYKFVDLTHIKDKKSNKVLEIDNLFGTSEISIASINSLQLGLFKDKLVYGKEAYKENSNDREGYDYYILDLNEAFASGVIKEQKVDMSLNTDMYLGGFIKVDDSTFSLALYDRSKVGNSYIKTMLCDLDGNCRDEEIKIEEIVGESKNTSSVTNPYGPGSAKQIYKRRFADVISGPIQVEIDGQPYDTSWLDLKDVELVGWVY
jgi:uncharacterized protein YxeA